MYFLSCSSCPLPFSVLCSSKHVPLCDLMMASFTTSDNNNCLIVNEQGVPGLWSNEEAIATELRGLQEKSLQQLNGLRDDLKQQLASGTGVVMEAQPSGECSVHLSLLITCNGDYDMTRAVCVVASVSLALTSPAFLSSERHQSISHSQASFIAKACLVCYPHIAFHCSETCPFCDLLSLKQVMARSSSSRASAFKHWLCGRSC